MTSASTLEFSFLRQQIVGVDCIFETPFGPRPLVYCDYTASGRCLTFVEQYLQRLQRHYANTHTEDDMTGRTTTKLLHRAEKLIKQAVNAGPKGRIIAVGTGSTGAIEKMQQIIGVELSPATRQRIYSLIEACADRETFDRFREVQHHQQPVVFVGPYEHHSNEVTWRQSLATVVEVNLTPDGAIDLAHLEALLKDPAFHERARIGSFSAASNVTGMRTRVHDIARLLHRYDALAFFDFAACAPYVEIDMNPQGGGREDPSLDAIFISPHKFLGGPGSSGILVFNERVYHRELAPTVAGGGTVDYVGPDAHDFIKDTEEREKAGTPGILQILKAALAFEVKRAVGVDAIERRELELTRRALARWERNENIEILGNRDASKRISIISFNVRDPRGRHLHPKFVTTLLDDLFGIQSRAGCSCAGPYGHQLLHIDRELSYRYRHWITQGYNGIKPGWCRLGLHYVMDDAEADYVIDAVDFVARYGYLFLALYEFDLKSGAWTHIQGKTIEPEFCLDAALHPGDDGDKPLRTPERHKIYQQCLQEAHTLRASLEQNVPHASMELAGELGELQFFSF